MGGYTYARNSTFNGVHLGAPGYSVSDAPFSHGRERRFGNYFAADGGPFHGLGNRADHVAVSPEDICS